MSFYDKSGTVHVGSPYIQDHSLPYPGVDHDIIPVGEIWALDKDRKRVDTFTGGQTAENSCGVSKHTILHNVNRVFTQCTYGGITMALLFVRNLAKPITNSINIIVVDTINTIA